MKVRNAKSRHNNKKSKQTHVNLNFVSLLVAVQQEMTSAIFNLATKVNNLATKTSEASEKSENNDIKVNARNYSETQCGFTDKYLCKTSYAQVWRRDWCCKLAENQEQETPTLTIPCPHLRMLPAFPLEKEEATAENKLWTNYTDKLNIDPDFCTAVDYTIDNSFAGKRFYCGDNFDSETGRNLSQLYPCKHLAPSGLNNPTTSPENSPQYSPSMYKSPTPSEIWSPNPFEETWV